MSGVVVAMQDVPDPVFAEQMVGPGAAIDPALDPDPLAVLAPVEGRIASLFPHALAIELADGRAVLVHLGIDTVELAGEGFTTHVAVGDDVAPGQLLVTWSPQGVTAGGRSPISPVVAVQAAPDDVRLAVPAGTTVAAGEALLHWA